MNPQQNPNTLCFILFHESESGWVAVLTDSQIASCNSQLAIFRGQLLNQYLYQGKEYRAEDGLNLYDFHARQYDPALGRFLAVDPAGQFSNPYMVPKGRKGNNPVVGVDPDGRSVVGAMFIGGVINVAFNMKNIDNFREMLGYFAVGAVTSAVTLGLSNGITSGFNFVTHTAGKVTFGAGFMAGVKGTFTASSSVVSSLIPSATSFLRGAAIGGASGFAGGFLSGAGNSLVNGESLGSSLSTGIRNGIVGGASGGMLSGLSSGIDAMKDGRSFFDGNRDLTNDKIRYAVKNYKGNSASSCGPSALIGHDKHMGGSLTREDIANNWYNGNTANGVSDLDLMQRYQSNTGNQVGILANNTKEEMLNAMMSGKRLAISMQHSSGVDHFVAVSKIHYRKYVDLSGQTNERWLIKIMDPYYGSKVKMDLSATIYRIFHIAPRL